MALPSVLAQQVFNSVLAKVGATGDTDPRYLTSWVQAEYLSRMGDNKTYYNNAEYRAVVNAVLAGIDASNLYGPDPSFRPTPGEIPRTSVIPGSRPQYQYRVLVEIDGPAASTATAVTIYSDTSLSFTEITQQAISVVQNTQSGRDYLSKVGTVRAEFVYYITVLTALQQR